MTKQTQKKKRDKLKTILVISTSSFLFIIAVCLILVFAILTDKNTSTHQKSENEITEIIKKNYVKGFKNTGNSGIFSFSMDENDINDLFEEANENIKDKHISKKYYQSIENHHYFYIDLKNTFLVKTRVVLDTVVTSINDDFSYNLGIVSCKMGKTNALTMLKKANILSEDIFYSDYLPIKYNEDRNEFVVSPLTFIDSFPKAETSDLFFGIAKDHLNLLSLNQSLLGFDLDFSKLSTSESSEIDLTTEYNLYNDLKTACESVDFSTLGVGESYTCHCINQDVMTSLLSKCCASLENQIIESTLTEEKVIFSLTAVKAKMKPDNIIELSLSYSLNAYNIDLVNEIELIDTSTTYFNSSFESRNSFKIGTYSYEGKNDKFVGVITNKIVSLFSNLAENQSNFFTFNNNNQTLNINLETMNNNFSDLDLKYSYKSVQVNQATKNLDFILTKPS